MHGIGTTIHAVKKFTGLLFPLIIKDLMLALLCMTLANLEHSQKLIIIAIKSKILFQMRSFILLVVKRINRRKFKMMK